MKNLTVIGALVIQSLFSCSHQTNSNQILNTSRKFIAAIRSGNTANVKNLIGVDLIIIGKNNELLNFDVKQCEQLLEKYDDNGKISIIITNEIDEEGRKLVKVPIFKGYDSTSKLTEAVLNLYFGPPNMVPLSKISGYKLNVHYNKKKVISPSDFERLNHLK